MVVQSEAQHDNDQVERREEAARILPGWTQLKDPIDKLSYSQTETDNYCRIIK